MAFAKLINLFAISSLAILFCTLNASPVTALSENGHMMRMTKRHHGVDVAKRAKRSSTGKRCRPRSTSATPTSTEAATSTQAAVQAAKSTPAKTSSTSTSSSSDSSSTSSSSSGGSSFTPSGNGKVGLAWPNGNDASLSQYVTSHVKYIYTWSESCPDQTDSLGLNCMPMLWSGASDKVSAFKSKVKAGYANIALGFNEVNEAGQANMSPQDAVDVWLDAIEPLKNKGYALVGPVTSSNPNGLTWMKEFYSICNGRCTVDYTPVHFYGTSGDDFITYVKLWHDTFDKPIMVTEFACQNYNTANENNGQQCSESQVQEFYSKTIEFMEGADYVVNYHAFGIMHDMQGVNTLDQLMASSGAPTSLGSQYINVNWS